MGIRRHRRFAALWLAGVLVAALAVPAAAEIDGFLIRGITAVDDVTLNSRLGTTSSATEHLINIADCEAYSGGKVRVEFGVDTTNYLNFNYGVAVAQPGKTCQTDGINFDGSDDVSCIVIENAGELSSTFDETIDLDYLSGGDCTDATEASSVLYLVITDDVAANPAVSEVLFAVDLLRPESPEIEDVTPGDRRIVVSWDDTGNEAEEGLAYEVFWSTESIDDPPGSDVKSATTSATHYDIEDDSLINGELYFVRVRAVDNADNESSLSAEMSIEPVPTTDFWERYNEVQGADPGGFCFIATAAYGSPMGPDLDALRAFRDQVLWPTGLGRTFVRGYYAWGRDAARWIADKPTVQAIVRVALTPLVWLARLTTTVGPLVALLLLGLTLALVAGSVRWWRRRSLDLAEVTP